MTRSRGMLRLIGIAAAVWLTASADFPMDTIVWLLGELGCC